ncbi:MAG: ComF family protein [Candidatus Doudnabacteria bacterium]|nr:ComF family protein [Candidatus Doudnabacteria bacterium]
MWQFALDLLFPVLCQDCGREGRYLCLECAANLPADEPRCIACGKPSLLGRIHDDCRTREWALTGVLVAASYDAEVVRDLIWQMKYNSVASIADHLAELLVDHLVKNDLVDYFSAATVIAVPLHKTRRRERGFNQAELLATKFAARLGLQHYPEALKKINNTKPQAKLKREERMKNVEGLFAGEAIPSLEQRKIILIDDVTTTGATLNECAKVLKTQNPSEIWGLVVARN